MCKRQDMEAGERCTDRGTDKDVVGMYNGTLLLLLLLLLSRFSRVRPCATPWTAAHQAPPSMEVSRQEYWSGVPLLGLLISVASRLVVEQSPQSMRASVVMVQGSVIPQHVGSP